MAAAPFARKSDYQRRRKKSGPLNRDQEIDRLFKVLDASGDQQLCVDELQPFYEATAKVRRNSPWLPRVVGGCKKENAFCHRITRASHTAAAMSRDMVEHARSKARHSLTDKHRLPPYGISPANSPQFRAAARSKRALE